MPCLLRVPIMPAIPIPQAFALAVQHHQAGRFAEAETIYRQILTVLPAHAGALHYLGVLAHQRGQNELAVTLIRRALAGEPNNAPAYSNLGEAYRAMGNFSAAIEAFRHALELDPGMIAAQSNLGAALRSIGDVDGAIAKYRDLLRIKPDEATAQYNLGNALRDRGALEEAMAAYHEVLRLRPDYADAHNNLGYTLWDLGDVDRAIDSFRAALRLNGEDAEVHSNLILALHYQPGATSELIDAEQRAWNHHFADSVRSEILLHTNDRRPDRRLRVGYVSPDLWDHVVGRNVLPLITHHDRQKFEVVCYAGAMRQDQITESIREHAPLWRNVAGLDDEELAKTIRQDGIDILVDLSQHTVGNRLRVFARKPAPMQVSFAGYPGGTGIEAIQFRISDRWLDGEGKMQDAGRKSQESGVYLIDSFWCYDPCGIVARVNELPVGKNGFVTIGNLNNTRKIHASVLRLWARVLRNIPNARMLLLSGPDGPRGRFLEFFAREGVEAERIDFIPRCSREEYFDLYHRLDLVLDSFPYGGHTTSLDALWMGVPVVTLASERSVSRAGLSVLNNLGLQELVTFTEDEYVHAAVTLANDLPRLAELRRTLRSRMENSVLMDAPHFARQIEAAYRTMWREWCAGGN